MSSFFKAIRLSVVLTCFIAGAAAMAGCNTVEGAGKDVEKGGEAVKDAAHNANGN